MASLAQGSCMLLRNSASEIEREKNKYRPRPVAPVRTGKDDEEEQREGAALGHTGHWHCVIGDCGPQCAFGLGVMRLGMQVWWKARWRGDVGGEGRRTGDQRQEDGGM